MRTQLIGVVRNWENCKGKWGFELKEEMVGFEKRVGMRREREGEVVRKSIVVVVLNLREKWERVNCDILVCYQTQINLFIKQIILTFFFRK